MFSIRRELLLCVLLPAVITALFVSYLRYYNNFFYFVKIWESAMSLDGRKPSWT